MAVAIQTFRCRCRRLDSSLSVSHRSRQGACAVARRRRAGHARSGRTAAAPCRALFGVSPLACPLVRVWRESARRSRQFFTSRPTLAAASALGGASALRKLTLVSNNRKEFGRVPRLAIENWADRAWPCFGVPGL